MVTPKQDLVKGSWDRPRAHSPLRAAKAGAPQRRDWPGAQSSSHLPQPPAHLALLPAIGLPALALASCNRRVYSPAELGEPGAAGAPPSLGGVAGVGWGEGEGAGMGGRAGLSDCPAPPPAGFRQGRPAGSHGVEIEASRQVRKHAKSLHARPCPDHSRPSSLQHVHLFSLPALTPQLSIILLIVPSISVYSSILPYLKKLFCPFMHSSVRLSTYIHRASIIHSLCLPSLPPTRLPFLSCIVPFVSGFTHSPLPSIHV